MRFFYPLWPIFWMTFIWSNSSCFLFTFLFPVGAAVSKAWGYFIHFCEFKSLIPLSLSVWLQKIRHLFLETTRWRVIILASFLMFTEYGTQTWNLQSPLPAGTSSVPLPDKNGNWGLAQGLKAEQSGQERQPGVLAPNSVFCLWMFTL